MNKEEFLEHLKLAFHSEAIEHLQTISKGLNKLESSKSSSNKLKIIEDIYREMHSLKGAARTVNRLDIEQICHPLETVLNKLKKQQLILTETLLANLHQCVDLLENNLRQPGFTPNLKTLKQCLSKMDPEELSTQPLKKMNISNSSPPTPPIKPTDAPSSVEQETLRVSLKTLDELHRKIEELKSHKLIIEQRHQELRVLENQLNKTVQQVKQSKKSFKILQDYFKENQIQERHVLNHVRTFMDFYQEFNIELPILQQNVNQIKQRVKEELKTFSKQEEHLYLTSQNLLMMPFSILIDRFPAMIREISGSLGKQVKFIQSGTNELIDKRILDDLQSPLTHLLRNAIAHGIEKPESRKKLNKSPTGKIRLNVKKKDGNHIILSIQDDGRGISLPELKKKANQSGLLSSKESQNISEEKLLNLIFESGLSTSHYISDISGRGLGMTIVKEKIEKLNGHIKIKSSQNIGTTFQIKLPIQLASFRGILLESNRQLFIISTSQSEQVIQISPQDIQTLKNMPTIQYYDKFITIVKLSEILNLPQNENHSPDKKISLIILAIGNQKKIALAVDRILGEQEVIPKKFKKPLLNTPNISGATILGNGQLVPILNSQELYKTALKIARPQQESQNINSNQSILIIEDSLVSRMLLSNILLSQGYEVNTITDGLEAPKLLEEKEFDLLISDIEMPGMDGITLTRQIRRTQGLQNLPIILITSLSTPEDKKKGMDAGANAYLTKGDFEENVFLDTVKRLLK